MEVNQSDVHWMGRRGGEYGTVSAKEVPKQIPVVAMSMSLSCVAVLHCPRLVQPSIVLEAVRKGECMPPLTVRNRSLRSSAESTPNRCQPLVPTPNPTLLHRQLFFYPTNRGARHTSTPFRRLFDCSPGRTYIDASTAALSLNSFSERPKPTPINARQMGAMQGAYASQHVITADAAETSKVLSDSR